MRKNTYGLGGSATGRLAEAESRAAPEAAAARAKEEAAPAARPAKKGSIDDLLGDVGHGTAGSGRWAAPPPPRPSTALPAPAPAEAANDDAPMGRDLREYRESDKSVARRSPAAAPAPRETASPARAPAAPASKRSRAVSDDEPGDGSEARRQATPLAEAGPSPAHASAPTAEWPPTGKPAASGGADAEKARAREARAESGESKDAALEESIRKAEKLFAEGHWAEAAKAFRALIARAPAHSLARTWKERLTASERALARARAAKAAEAEAAVPAAPAR